MREDAGGGPRPEGTTFLLSEAQARQGYMAAERRKELLGGW